MNELMVVYEGGQWIYFRTRHQTADKAFQDYEETLNNAGINSDNMQIHRVLLRDENGNEIDKLY